VIGDGTKTYSWDVRGRLTGMTGPGLTASFLYDYLGRRYQKTINGTTTTFLNDGADLVSEITGSGTSQTLHGPSIDEPLARDGLFFTPNQLGSTTTLTDATGIIKQSYSYSPYGETTASDQTLANPFQFTGRENDGTGLMYYRARYYAPGWGRFISEDPIGVLGGLNRYGYAGNNPISYIDPLGLDWLNGLSSYFAGWGDTLTFGGTGRVRQWLGVDGVVDYGSGAYTAGSYTGIGNGLALGAAGAARLIGARLAAAGATTIAANPQTYQRLISEAEKIAIEGANGAVPSTGCKIADATRVFQPASWPLMQAFANSPLAQQFNYSYVVNFQTSQPVTRLAWDFPPHTFYVGVQELNGLLVGPPIITPIGQFHP
jgi:RHS repeat-associated protein